MDFITPEAAAEFELLFNKLTIETEGICQISKSHLSTTTMCDPIHNNDSYGLGDT
jgi:hypothetical protein